MTTAEIRRKLLALRPALLSDAMGKGGAMDHDMRCWSAVCRMAGPAFTARVHTADVLIVGSGATLLFFVFRAVSEGRKSEARFMGLATALIVFVFICCAVFFAISLR